MEFRSLGFPALKLAPLDGHPQPRRKLPGRQEVIVVAGLIFEKLTGSPIQMMGPRHRAWGMGDEFHPRPLLFGHLRISFFKPDAKTPAKLRMPGHSSRPLRIPALPAEPALKGAQ